MLKFIKIISWVLVWGCCSIVFGQTPLRSIEKCKDGSGVVKDSCFVMTDVNGMQTYIDLQDLIDIINNAGLCSGLRGFTIGTPVEDDYFFYQNGSNCRKATISDLLGINKYNCDSVLACLTSGTLCNALGQFTTQSIVSTDYIFFEDNSGVCHKGLASSIPGFGFDCDSVLACLNDGILCDAFNAFTTGTPNSSNYILYIDGSGNCKRGLISSLPGLYNCDSVEACLNNGLLCDALKEFPFLSVEQTGEIIWVRNNGECKRGNVSDLLGTYALCDSLNALNDLKFDTTGKLIWLTSGGLCKKGDAKELFRNLGGCDSFTNTGCKLRYVCGATGAVSTSDYHIETGGGGVNCFDLLLDDNLGNSCTRSTFCIGSIVSNIASSLDCSQNKLVVTRNGSTFDVALPTYTLTATDLGSGNRRISLLQDGVVCSSANFSICDGASCGSDLMAPQSIAQVLPNAKSLKRYKTFVDADNDTSLPSGGFYLVGKSRSIQVKP